MPEPLALLHLLAGDPFLTEKNAALLYKEIEKKFPGQLFIQAYSLTDTPLDSVLTQARTLPFLAPRRSCDSKMPRP